MTAFVETPTTAIDGTLATLVAHKDEWARLPLARKIQYLKEMRPKIAAVAEEWVAAAVKAKQIAPDSPLTGEEWTSGPWAVLYGLNRLVESLEAIDKTGKPELKASAIRTKADGQVVVRVFPNSLYDRVLISGITAEVWMQPGVTAQNLRDTMAVFYSQTAPEGKVALVLGAGNIASIAPLDVFYKLFVDGEVCLLKMNPINEYLGVFMERIFADFIRDGYVATAYGGAEVGAYLCNHPDIATIHITGGNKTHDAIVFGAGPEGEARRRLNEPILHKPITSELGNVSPTIVVPGPWSKADLQYQAEHIATQKMHNAGFNCIASQVLVLPATWNQKEALLDALRQTFKQVEPRYQYYTGQAQRRESFLQTHSEAEVLDTNDTPRLLINVDSGNLDDICFKTEAFANVYATTTLPGQDAAQFLQNAVAFCNDTLWGTLGANILIHPATLKELGAKFDQAVADLRYGCVAINSWTGVGFLLAQTTWGAFPGHPENDIQSGRGVVHNSFMFDKPQKSVIRQPFYPFPRNLRHGEVHSLPKPPWFVTNKQASHTARRLTMFEAQPGIKHLAGIFMAALRG